MRALLLAAVWLHLAAGVLLTGALFMLLLAGPPTASGARRWDRATMRWSLLLVLLAVACGIAWLLARTAVFENRPHAALEARAVWHAAMDTWAGLVWLTRLGLLTVLGAFLATRADVEQKWNWIGARGEALLLAALALGLASASSHAAAISPGTASAVLADTAHLLAAGCWVGGLGALGLLLWAACRDAGADALPYAARAARRFSRAALIAMLVLIGSGVMSATAEVDSIPGLIGTGHGRLLLGKLAILAAILAVAVVNRTRVLPALCAPGEVERRRAAQRLAAFVALEAILALAVVGLAAAMTLTTPARHGDPSWPLPFRLTLDAVSDVPATRWRALVGGQLAVIGLLGLIASVVARRRRAVVRIAALGLVAIGAGIGLPPLAIHAYPTTYRRSLVTYHAGSIAMGMAIYREQCARCHSPADTRGGTRNVVGAIAGGDSTHHRLASDLRAPAVVRRPAGELFWLVGHGVPERGMPGFESRLDEVKRWDVINFVRALGAADGARAIGPRVQIDRAWLVAPDFAISMGPLAPGALRDYRGQRMVLLVLYTPPESGARMAELAKSYNVLSILGVEIVAVPTRASATAIRDLGSSPPVLFPVITDGSADIVAAYRVFADRPHAEFLIDRQGYIRAVWRDLAPGGSSAVGVQSQVETLNEEKSPPPFPDDHVH